MLTIINALDNSNICRSTSHLAKIITIWHGSPLFLYGFCRIIYYG
nr:MAG TPA: hypothetical protein [Caudoviricetes sp.]